VVRLSFSQNLCDSPVHRVASQIYQKLDWTALARLLEPR